MPKLATSLTDTKIKSLKPKNKDYIIGDGNSLFLKVYKSGKKIFLFNCKDKRTNKNKRIKIGEYPNMTLAQARIQKVKIYENILNNKSAHFNNLTLVKTFNEFIANKNDVSQRYKDQMISLMNRFILVKIGHLPPNEVTRKDIVNCLSPIISSGKKVSAKKVLVVLNMLFKYCVLNEYTEHNIIADIDKKTLIGKTTVKHYAYFNTDEKISNLLKSIKGYLGNEKTIDIY